MVGWITQLVVDRTMRGRYIATHLLRSLKNHVLFQNITAIGLVSSHPAACASLGNYDCFLPCQLHHLHIILWPPGVSTDTLDTDFIHANAQDIFNASPIEYLLGAQLRGSLFQDVPEDGVVSSVYTEFFVDYAETSAVLQEFRKKHEWCLGKLLDGHEYLIIALVESSVSPSA